MQVLGAKTLRKSRQDLANRKACLVYPDYLDLQNAAGNTEGIKIVGLDAKTREFLLKGVIPGLRKKGTTPITPEHRSLLAEATNTDVSLINAINPQRALTENQISLLNNLEFTIITATTKHNLRSDIMLTPKPAAQALFDSYEAAMRFVAGPICTLDEYIDFGADGCAPGRRSRPTPRRE